MVVARNVDNTNHPGVYANNDTSGTTATRITRTGPVTPSVQIFTTGQVSCNDTAVMNVLKIPFEQVLER